MITYLKQLISNSPGKFISYADYIDAALYHPQHGYYMKEQPKIGRNGDFITSSNISDVYGRLIAKWFYYACQKFSLPFYFCEVGGGTGRFAQAFLQEWTESIKQPLHYFMIEASPYHSKLQSEIRSKYPFITNLDSLEELRGFKGMIFSNELFDALPVHVIEKVNGRLYEIMVGMENQELLEKRVPLENPDILQFLEENHLELNDRQRIEIPLAMEKLLHGISQVFGKGFLVTADYGYTKGEWMHPSRFKGSLRGYFQHQMIDNVLKNPGKMDITTHIHFDYLQQKGEQLNLAFVTKLRQDEFLIKAGILKELADHYDPNPFSEVSRQNRAIRSLIMPAGISSYFHIMIQQKKLMLSKNDLFKE